jgi:dipeptidyl aminopeptidase/acylaminoacyl peptidase
MKIKHYLNIGTFSIICGIGLSAHAQKKALSPFSPAPAEMARTYQEASLLDTAARKIAVNTDIIPRWNPDKKSFWYRKNLDGRNWAYIYVDVAAGQRREAFDHSRLATALQQQQQGKPMSPERLKISDMFFRNSGSILVLKTGDQWLEADLKSYALKATTDTTGLRYNPKADLQRGYSRWAGARSVMVSPDGNHTISLRKGNIVRKDKTTGQEFQLTQDGSTDSPYSEFSWSPDSKILIAYKTFPKKIKDVHYVLSSVPGTTRGQLKSHEYAQPGDAFTSYEPYIFYMASRQRIKVAADAIDFFGPQPLHWRSGNNRYFTYEKVDRGHQRFRVIEVDTQTGKTRNIVDEQTSTFIYENRLYTHYLPATNEMIWTSEQSGYRHVYLVSLLTGKQQQVTKGNWVVRDVDSVDLVKREIWYSASGKHAGEDPYFIHHYRVGFGGKNTVAISPEKGTHQLSYAPDRSTFLDTYSEVNVAPVTVLKRTSDGKVLLELERGDTKSFSAAGLTLPDVFVAKGRDGQTDIWGIVCRPSKMDSSKTYPVIEYIYAGPQDSFVPKSFTPYSEMQSMAELGFIVVQMDGMGTANRSKAFHDVCWKNLADAGFPDRILWMQAMAQRYPNADISRVGIYGTSAGGQNSTGALLFHPEFYKAAVSACGCHDNRVDKQWWNEQWMGYPVGVHYEEQSNVTNAAKLQGNLLLIVGEADENVPPESTFRMADALIKANKDFDFLCVPGMGHSDGGSYGRRRKRDFFVEHLLHAAPPLRNVSPVPAK